MKLDAKDIIKKLQSSKKVKDYSLLIAFFLVFTVFLWFAIRPNLVTAFSLQQELIELREKDSHYEEVILSIVEFQSKLESNREDLYLLDEIVPDKPQVVRLINDIQDASERADLVITRIEVQEVELLDSERIEMSEEVRQNTESISDSELLTKEYAVVLSAQTTQERVDLFVEEITRQRRLQLLNQVILNPETQQNATESADMSVQFEIKGMYL